MKNQNANDPASKFDVQIVGPLKLQNELMAWFLSQTTGLNCLCCKDLDVQTISADAAEHRGLLLLDCLGSNLSLLQSKIRILTDSGKNRFHIAQRWPLTAESSLFFSEFDLFLRGRTFR